MIAVYHFFKVDLNLTGTPLWPSIQHWSREHYVSLVTDLWIKVGETANPLQIPFSSVYFTWRLWGMAFFWKILFPCEHVILQFCKLCFHLLNWPFLISRHGTCEVLSYFLDLAFTIQLKARVILVWDFPSRYDRQTFLKPLINIPLEYLHNCTGDLQTLILVLWGIHV